MHHPLENFHVSHIEWNPDGRSLVLMDKDKFCIGFPLDEDHQLSESDVEAEAKEVIAQELYAAH